VFCRGIVSAEALDGSKDVIGGFGPSERLGIGVVSVDESDVSPEGGDAGRKRRHIFDFRFTTTEGKRLLAAVKPSALVAISGIDRSRSSTVTGFAAITSS
jgi:hypothetical protein